jgi:hypothetical protein
MVDLKFDRDPLRSRRGEIGHGDQLSFGNQAADVFRVTPPHLSHSQHPNSQLCHAQLCLRALAL